MVPPRQGPRVSQNAAPAARRHRRWLLHSGWALTALGTVVFLVSMWGITWMSPPRFPNDPPTAAYPKDFPMRLGIGLNGGRFFMTNRITSWESGWHINRELPPWRTYRFWPEKSRFVKYDGTRQGSSAFWIAVEIPAWTPPLAGLSLLGAYWLKRAERRRRKGLCPHCCYNRQGLSEESTCPECGAPSA